MKVEINAKAMGVSYGEIGVGQAFLRLHSMKLYIKTDSMGYSGVSSTNLETGATCSWADDVTGFQPVSAKVVTGG